MWRPRHIASVAPAGALQHGASSPPPPFRDCRPMRLVSLLAAPAAVASLGSLAGVQAQVLAGAVMPDAATSAPVLSYSVRACSRGSFGVDYGVGQVCFYERPRFEGGCVCVGPTPTRAVVGAFRLESSEVGSVRVAPGLAVNVVLDEYSHEIKSLVRGSAKPMQINYAVVAHEHSACVFEEAGFFGRKFCLRADHHLDAQFHATPFAFQSLMLVPDQRACVQAEIRRGKRVSHSAALPAEIENGGSPRVNASRAFDFSGMDEAATRHAPYKKLRLVKQPAP